MITPFSLQVYNELMEILPIVIRSTGPWLLKWLNRGGFLAYRTLKDLFVSLGQQFNFIQVFDWRVSPFLNSSATPHSWNILFIFRWSNWFSSRLFFFTLISGSMRMNEAFNMYRKLMVWVATFRMPLFILWYLKWFCKFFSTCICFFFLFVSGSKIIKHSLKTFF